MKTQIAYEISSAKGDILLNLGNGLPPYLWAKLTVTYEQSYDACKV